MKPGEPAGMHKRTKKELQFDLFKKILKEKVIYLKHSGMNLDLFFDEAFDKAYQESLRPPKPKPPPSRIIYEGFGWPDSLTDIRKKLKGWIGWK